VRYNVKLTHFNKYVSDFSYTNDDLRKPLHTKENFHQAGKWTSEYWKDFEDWMDAHLKPEFKWREKCEWEKKFKNTDRKYLTVSLGFEVAALVPYTLFQSIDKKKDDIDNITKFVVNVAKAYKDLLVAVPKAQSAVVVS